MDKPEPEMSPTDLPADLPAVVDAFSSCRRADGTLATDHYLAATNGLVRLFHSFGKGVTLALQGIDKPIKSLELLRVKGIGCNYSSFDLLLNFEKKTTFDHINDKSGTTSVNKLYLYMEFMLQFLSKLAESLEKNESFKRTDKVATCQKTTADYHPKYIQVTTKLLLMKSPGRQELLKLLAPGARGWASPREILREILVNAYPVQRRFYQLIKDSEC